MGGLTKDRKRGNTDDFRITSHFLALMPFVVSKCAFFSVSLSDILPDGRVLLLPDGNSDIESCGFSVILFALKLAKRITLCEAQ